MSLNERKKIKAQELYPNDPDLREAYKDGFDYYEEALKKENRPSMYWSIFSFLAIVGLSLYMRTLDQKSLGLYLASLLTIGVLLINVFHIAKWLGKSWTLPISFGVGLLFFFLGRGDVSFETTKKLWVHFWAKEVNVEPEILPVEETSIP